MRRIKAPKTDIGKLTPAHFANGASFDKEAFASLVNALQKSKRSAWKMPDIWLAGMLLAAMFASLGGAICYFLAVACIFAGMIGGSLSVMGVGKQLKAAKAKLGITQNDINAAVKQMKAESQQQAPAGAAVSAEFAQKPTPTPTKGAKILFIISSVLVMMVHALMIILFIANAIDGDSQTARYSIFAIGSALAILGVILMMKKQMWAYVLVVGGIVSFCAGLGEELNGEESIIILMVMILLSALLLFAAFRLRSKEHQAASTGEPKPFRLTGKQMLWTAAAIVVVILAILFSPKGKYEQTLWSYDMYEAQLRESGKWGFIDRDKKQEIVPCIYDKTDRTYHILKVKLNGKWGMFNKSGKEIVPCRYDSIGDELKDSLLFVMNNGKHGLIRFDGREAVPCIYDEPLQSKPSSTLLKAASNGKYGFIDRNGNVIVPVLYKNADLVAGGLIKVEQEGEDIYFDLQGNKVDNDRIAVMHKRGANLASMKMKVNYDARQEAFTFTDVETGEPLKYDRIMLNGVEVLEMRYHHNQQSGGMIQFVTKAREIRGMEQHQRQQAQNERTATTTYREESTIAYPLYNELPYTLEGGTLTIKR